ncbi:tripartite tricarboxylate transporter substrate binding protein [Belnapia sp. T6]|uniref:Tripartite tricarboxylate transporter substrate binding protein n=1 Tax=Belnapia mucosa TaxID=2804532 RepID=A0ABS1V3R1_9PROT|nr:tripartite tricarboxylate transporter substrate binding protein [Belnapia mucosa]MBL6456329.1 tripartite tricarboxylate transporter substrate binding protein [Belnapia mucosa]
MRKALALALALLGLAGPARAEEAYPARPVRVVLPFAPGGPTDVVGRLMSDRLSGALGQRFLVENRPGGGGNIAAEAVKLAPADGHTLIFATVSAMGVNPALQRAAPYDPVRDFVAVAQVGTTPIVLVVHPSLPVTDLASLTAYLRQPGQAFTYGSAGSGSVTHLAGELLRARLGIADLPHVSYRGSGPMLVDLMAGRLTFGFDPLPTSAGHIRSGALRPVGMATAQRANALPEIPTLQEQGLADFDVGSWYAFFAPAGTPAAVVNRLNRAVNTLLQDEALLVRLRELGVDPTPDLSPAQVGELVRAEAAKWAAVVRLSGTSME